MIAPVALACALAVAAPGDWTTDAEGRAFRVAFDPDDRVLLGAAWAVDPAADPASAVRLEAAWYLSAVGPDRGVRWKLTHALAEAALTLGAPATIEATLYRGQYLRWSEDGAITLPTSPPTRLPFPLDLGFAVEVGAVRARPGARDDRIDIGVVAAELLFDAWRSPDAGSWLVLGIGADYDLEIDAADRVTHVVAPFTAGRLTLRHTWCQGRQRVEVELGGATAWTSATTGSRWRERAHAEVSWEPIVMAIDDRPLSLAVRAAWDWDERAPERARHAVDLTAGLRLGL